MTVLWFVAENPVVLVTANARLGLLVRPAFWLGRQIELKLPHPFSLGSTTAVATMAWYRVVQGGTMLLRARLHGAACRVLIAFWFFFGLLFLFICFGFWGEWARCD